jgi:hypothetical protein
VCRGNDDQGFARWHHVMFNLTVYFFLVEKVPKKQGFRRFA